MDSFGFLRDYIAEQFSHKYASPKDPWPVREDVILFQNNETGQSLMYEYAESLAARAFLKMCDLPFCFRMEPNAEYMSPTGHPKEQTIFSSQLEKLVLNLEKTPVRSSVHEAPEAVVYKPSFASRYPQWKLEY